MRIFHVSAVWLAIFCKNSVKMSILRRNELRDLLNYGKILRLD